MLSIPPELVRHDSDSVILAVGQIVMLSDINSTASADRLLKQHVTVTVPVPHVVLDGSRGMLGGFGSSGGAEAKLHVLTYRKDRETEINSGFATTCLPCAFDYTTNRRGVVSIRAWNLTG